MDVVIVKEIIYKPVDVVWSLITELEYMKQWFFEDIPSFSAEVGFKTEFNVVSNGRNFLHSWEIVEVTENESIVYKWQYPEYTHKDSYVKFCLNYVNEHETEVTITCEGIENYPNDIPEFTYESCRAGWEYFMGRLVSFAKSK
ncbi:SRPBCC family protein [Tenacibaculum sp. MEBiC06402]|uniref:SRPBCC family protein n=1 Tax=unclassified Tenacibaculum TaxID=2635139 RepID=UPI003B9C096A